ncbi:MAG: PEP-CTERM sorting domain-containing protein [Planctomycetota bacterium]
MKKSFGVSLVVVGMVLMLTGGAAQANILINENFTHPDGNLVGQVPTPGPGAAWAVHSGTTGPVQVSNGTALIVQGNAEDVNCDTGTAMAAGDRWYAGYDLSVTGGTTNVYFGMFLTGTSYFTSRIWVTAPASDGDFRLCLSNDNSMTDADGEVFTGDLDFGTTYRVVSYYDYDAQAGKLWIDPVDESSPGFLATDPGYSNASFGYAFRQSSGNSTQTIDNLIVATTFDEAVPEPATIAMLLIGGLALRRRR